LKKRTALGANVVCELLPGGTKGVTILDVRVARHVLPFARAATLQRILAPAAAQNEHKRRWASYRGDRASNVRGLLDHVDESQRQLRDAKELPWGRASACPGSFWHVQAGRVWERPRSGLRVEAASAH
jgi:hypothetical protein